MDLKDQDYWLDIFKKWSNSGLAQKVFCMRNDLRYAEFVTWRSRLIEAGLTANAYLTPHQKSIQHKKVA